jgi:hypothetical protein
MMTTLALALALALHSSHDQMMRCVLHHAWQLCRAAPPMLVVAVVVVVVVVVVEGELQTAVLRWWL